MTEYNQQQMAEKGKQLARLQQELMGRQNEKKDVMKSFKAQIDALKEEISVLSAEMDGGLNEESVAI